MDVRSLSTWILPLTLGALLAFTPPVDAGGHTELPPILPHDIRSDPEFKNVSAETDEIAFEIELGKIREYTGEFSVDLHIDDTRIAKIEDIWPPDTDRMNVSTSEDADQGPGVWSPSVGKHPFNLTVEAEAKTFPLEFKLPMGPDLSVEDTETADNESAAVSLEPASPDPGDPVTFEVTVANDGNWDTPEGEQIPLRLSIDGETVGERTVSDVPAGNESTVTFEDAWTAETGYHNVSVDVATDAIEEVSDDNNHDWFSLAVSENGLEVAELTVEPTVAASGETVTAVARVENAGEEAAEASTTGLYRDDTFLSGVETPALEPGEAANVTWELQPPVGAFELKAVPNAEDPPETPPPRPERASAQLVVGPDLSVRVDGTTPEHPVEGQEVTFSGTLVNRGSSTDAEAVTVGLRDGREGPIVTHANVSAPDPGDSREFSITFTPDRGEHLFALAIDPDDQIEEAREGNNEGHLSLTVRKDNPEVFIDDLSFTEPRLLPGQPTPASVTVVNVGNRTAEDLVARFTLDGSPLGAGVALGPIERQESATAQSRNWTPEPGEHTLEVRVGTRQDLAARQPLANASTTVEVANVTPEAEVGTLQVQPEVPQPGDEVRLSVDVTNVGEVPAGSFDVRFEADGSSLGIQRVDGLEPGQTRTVESPAWTYETGVQNASAHVDPDGEVFSGDGRVASASLAEAREETPVLGALGVAAALALAGIARRNRS